MSYDYKPRCGATMVIFNYDDKTKKFEMINCHNNEDAEIKILEY